MNKEILFNLKNKINPKLCKELSDELEIIISELDFNNYEAAFEKLINLIKFVEDSL